MSDLDAVGVLEHLRQLGVAQLVDRPREDVAGSIAEPLGDRDRHDPKGEQGVLLGQADADDSGRGLLDRRLAVLVRNRHREHVRLGRRGPISGTTAGSACTVVAAGDEHRGDGQGGQARQESAAAGVHGGCSFVRRLIESVRKA